MFWIAWSIVGILAEWGFLACNDDLKSRDIILLTIGCGPLAWTALVAALLINNNIFKR